MKVLTQGKSEQRKPKHAQPDQRLSNKAKSNQVKSSQRRSKSKQAGDKDIKINPRAVASDCLLRILYKGEALNQAIEACLPRDSHLQSSDRGQTLALVRVALRSRGRIEHLLASFLVQPLKKFDPTTRALLCIGVVDLCCFETPSYAVLSEIQKAATCLDRNRSKGLLRAVLGKVAASGHEIWRGLDPTEHDFPNWLLERWAVAYGKARAEKMAAMSLIAAPLDIITDGDAPALAKQLGGQVVGTASVRLSAGQDPTRLSGYDEGAWWVQDVSSALVAQAFGPNLKGQRIYDLCAAPGGKTAWLSRAGAQVTAVDSSLVRTRRLHGNLKRLSAPSEYVVEDVLNWTPKVQADGVLLDAPCSGTGTLRRHPDGLWSKTAAAVADLAANGAKLLDAAARLVRPGGRLIYSVCSLEPEEGEDQICKFLATHPSFHLVPIATALGAAMPNWTEDQGRQSWLRILPTDTPPQGGGCDGFFIAVLESGH